MFWVYILYSESYDKYYVGYTNDLKRRSLEHNELSENSFTSRFRPWILKCSFEIGEDRGIARRVELHIKKQKSRDYIESIIMRNSISQIIARFKDG